MKTFNLKSFLTENKEQVLYVYADYSTHATFNGTSLKSYMVDVMNNMMLNNPRSEAKAKNLFSQIIYTCAYKITEIQVINDRDAKTSAKYKDTAYMALV